MWYERRWMRTYFYLGVMCVIIGIGILKIDPDYRLASALIICLGAALMVLGFWGIVINAYVEQEFRRKKKRSSSQQK